jgi:pimeloyl-ACP methyl ester carboxylesterase
MQSLHVVRAGHGPRVVLVHGSATDHATWSIQLASPLRRRFELVAYDRRSATTIAAQAADLAQVIGDAPALVVGSSFGAVVALELARSRLAPCAGLVLIEPPMAPNDDPQDMVAVARAAVGGAPWPVAPAPSGFLDDFDRKVAEAGGPAAAELFLRTVLGEPAFAKIPRAFLERSTAKWAEIRADCLALTTYQPRYAALGALDLPVRLVGGERSAPYFRVTLDALAAALPDARIEIVPGAGHMLHAEAPSRFTELVTRFADELDLR